MTLSERDDQAIRREYPEFGHKSVEEDVAFSLHRELENHRLNRGIQLPTSNFGDRQHLKWKMPITSRRGAGSMFDVPNPTRTSEVSLSDLPNVNGKTLLSRAARIMQGRERGEFDGQPNREEYMLKSENEQKLDIMAGLIARGAHLNNDNGKITLKKDDDGKDFWSILPKDEQAKLIIKVMNLSDISFNPADKLSINNLMWNSLDTEGKNAVHEHDAYLCTQSVYNSRWGGHADKSDDLEKRAIDTALKMKQLHSWMDSIDDIKEKDKFFATTMSSSVAKTIEFKGKGSKDYKGGSVKLEPITQDISQAFQECYGLDAKSAHKEAEKIILKSTTYADLDLSDKVKKLTFDFLEVIENIKLKVLSMTSAKGPLDELKDHVKDMSTAHRVDNVSKGVIQSQKSQKETHHTR